MSDRFLSSLEQQKYNLLGKLDDECLLECKISGSNHRIYFTTAVCIRDRVYFDMFGMKRGSVNFPAPPHIAALDDEDKKHLAVILRATTPEANNIASYLFAHIITGKVLLLSSTDDDHNNTKYTIV